MTDFQWRHIPVTRQRSRSHESTTSAATSRYMGNAWDLDNKESKPDAETLHNYPTTMEEYEQLPTFPPRPDYSHDGHPVNPSTLLAGFDPCPNDPNHPASMPIYQTSTFVQPSVSNFGPYDYTRSGNPTRTALETLIGKIEGAYAAFCFTSGMSALMTIVHLLKAGDEVIACSDLYGGMHRLLTQVCQRQGIKVRFLDTTNLSKMEEEISNITALVHVETPSNPLMRITDIQGLSNICQRYGALLSVDSTMMSPILMNPLKLGVDIVMHSATKFLNGHSDVMAGVLATGKQELAKRIAFLQNAEGTALAPHDCWLILRGMKTMALRVERQQENAMKIVTFLRRQALVTKVHYAGQHNGQIKTTSKHPKQVTAPLPLTTKYADSVEKSSTTKTDYAIHLKQARGGGSVISFETGAIETSRKIVDAVRMFKITVSFGSVNSLIEMPCLLSHASIPAEKRTLPSDLIRLSVGIEHSKDLLDDLARAFALVQQALDTENDDVASDKVSVGSDEKKDEQDVPLEEN